MTKRADRREYRVELFDGRAAATVYVVDGYGRPRGPVYHVAPVRTKEEAVAAAIEEGIEEVRA